MQDFCQLFVCPQIQSLRPDLWLGLSHLVLSVNCVSLSRDCTTAEECLKHPWLTQSGVDEPAFKVRGALEKRTCPPGKQILCLKVIQILRNQKQESICVTEELIAISIYFRTVQTVWKGENGARPFPNDLNLRNLCYRHSRRFYLLGNVPFRTLTFLHSKHYLWTSDQMVHGLKMDDQVSVIET